MSGEAMARAFLVFLLLATAVPGASSWANDMPVLTEKDVLIHFDTPGLHSGRYYSERALAARMEGAADVQCLIAKDNHLTHCQVLAEKPRDWGFGKAAADYYSQMQADPVTRTGAQTAGREIREHMNFRLPER
jgi:hypothetical protein